MAPVKLSDQVVFTETQDGGSPLGILLHLGTRRYYSLNETGLFIWKQLEARHSLVEVARAMHQSFEVSEAAALQSAQRLVEDLLAAGLLAAA